MTEGSVPVPGAVSTALGDALDDAHSGSGRVVLLLGEAGIGKTSAARGATEAARTRGMRTRWAGCSMGGATVAHVPWSTLLAGLGPWAETAAASLGGFDIDDAIAAGAARAEAYSAVLTALEAATCQRATLLVLDDLHWADEGTLQLLDTVARHAPAMPLLIVGTYRDTDIEPGSTLTRLGAGADRVEVPGLDEQAAATLLSRHVGAARGDELAADVIRLTGGNPFLIVQLGRLVADRGMSIGGSALPAGARDLLQQRLRALGDDDRELLVAAGVLGHAFRIPDLLRVVDRSPRDVAQMLERAASTRIVARARERDDTWTFVHDLFRQAAVDLGGPVKVAALHERAAAVLAESDAEPAVVAAHLRAAGPERTADAASWAVRAGDRALGAMAWEEAADHFRRARDALAALPAGVAADVRSDALAGLGRSLLLAGDYEHGSEAFLALAALARTLGSPHLLARAALGFSADLSGFEVRLFDQRQIDVLEEAAQVLRGTDDRALLATVLARLSVAMSMSATGSPRLALAEQAVELASAVGEPIVLARALAAHCDAIAGPADVDRRLAQSSEIVALAVGAGDGPLELLGRRLRYVALLERGDVAGLEREVTAFALRASALGNPLYSWYVPLWQSQMAVVAGDVAAAERLAGEAESIGRRAGSLNAPMLATVLQLAIYWQRGEFEQAVRAFEDLVVVAPELAEHITAIGGQAASYALVGRTARATALLDRAAVLGVASQLDDAEWLSNMFNIVRAAVLVDHPVLADAVAVLEPFADLVVFEGIGAGLYGAAARMVALGCRSTGRIEESVRYARLALEVNRRFGGMLAADALRTLAECTESAGDHAAARRLHADADQTYSAVGATHLVRTGETVDTGRDGRVNELRRDGDAWHIRYAGRDDILKHSKGLADLAVLLSQPGRELHVAELAGVPVALGSNGGGDALDRQAIDAYRRRLVDLAEERDEADARHDLGRAERLGMEYDAIVDELAAAVGVGGRTRAAGPEPVERLRKAVSARIHDAIRRIATVNEPLGRHLSNAIHTGTYLSYTPETVTTWRCQTRSGASAT